MKRGWVAHWTDDDTGERLHDCVGCAKSDAREALSKHLPANSWGVRVARALPGQEPDFILAKGGERVALVIE